MLPPPSTGSKPRHPIFTGFFPVRQGLVLHFTPRFQYHSASFSGTPP